MVIVSGGAVLEDQAMGTMGNTVREEKPHANLTKP